MSIRSAYICDGCNRAIGQKVHLSILIQGGATTGVAIPPDMKNYELWRVERSIKGQLYHFCSGDCIKKWADRLLKEFIVKTNERKNNS